VQLHLIPLLPAPVLDDVEAALLATRRTQTCARVCCRWMRAWLLLLWHLLLFMAEWCFMSLNVHSSLKDGKNKPPAHPNVTAYCETELFH